MNEFEADELEARDVGLAFYVAIQNTNNWPADTCVAWVESKAATCGRDRSQGYLCTRHHTTATKRREKDVEKVMARVEKRRAELAEKRRLHSDDWKAKLAWVETELARRTGTLTDDRAAYGGVGVPAIEKHRNRQFSDTNVQRVGELLREQKRLRKLIGEEA